MFYHILSTIAPLRQYRQISHKKGQTVLFQLKLRIITFPFVISLAALLLHRILMTLHQSLMRDKMTTL